MTPSLSEHAHFPLSSQGNEIASKYRYSEVAIHPHHSPRLLGPGSVTLSKHRGPEARGENVLSKVNMQSNHLIYQIAAAVLYSCRAASRVTILGSRSNPLFSRGLNLDPTP